MKGIIIMDVDSNGLKYQLFWVTDDFVNQDQLVPLNYQLLIKMTAEFD